MKQVRQLHRVGFQSFEKELHICKLAVIRRLQQQLQALCVRVGFLRGIETEVKVRKDFQIRERQGDTRQGCVADGVMQNDVSHFVGQDGRERGLIGQHIEKPAAQNDGSADDERLEWRCEQHTATNSSDVEIVGEQQIIGDGLQYVVDFAVWCHEPGQLQPLHQIV